MVYSGIICAVAPAALYTNDKYFCLPLSILTLTNENVTTAVCTTSVHGIKKIKVEKLS